MKRLIILPAFIGTLLIVTGCSLAAMDTQNKMEGPDEMLINTYWKLVRLNGAPIVTHENFREAHLVLHPDASRLAGATGCNTLMGSYRVEKEYIVFDHVTSTKMDCPTDQMKAERDFLTALKHVTAWSVDGAMLVLTVDNSEPLAVFEAVHLY